MWSHTSFPQVLGSRRYPVNPVSCDYKAEGEYPAVKILLVHAGNFVYRHICITYCGNPPSSIWNHSTLTGHTATPWVVHWPPTSCSAMITLKSEASAPVSVLCCSTSVSASKLCENPADFQFVEKLSVFTISFILSVLVSFCHLNEDQPIITASFVLSQLMNPASYTKRTFSAGFCLTRNHSLVCCQLWFVKWFGHTPTECVFFTLISGYTFSTSVHITLNKIYKGNSVPHIFSCSLILSTPAFRV